MAYIWGLAALSSLSPYAASCTFAQTTTAITISKGSLQDALVSLARQTGASIGMPGRMKNIRVKALSGEISAAQALDQLLKGTGYRAVAVGPNIWRLVAVTPIPKLPRPKPPPVSKPPNLPRPAPAPSPEFSTVEDIIVTAAKRTDSLETTPIDSTVVEALALRRFTDVPNSAAVASMGTGLTLSNVGPGLNRAFLRGVGDSPFNGQTQSTVATLLDDARVTFNAPDPDLRLVDVDRVELLKGPQGPLYGTGAIGGVVRIVTAKPKLDRLGLNFTASAEALAHGGAGFDASATINLPLVQNELGVRVTAYAAGDPGWIDNGLPQGRNSNRSQVGGGRVALRWRPDPEWTVDLAGAGQFLHVDDSQYVTGLSTRRRGGILPEPHDNDFINARLGIVGKIGDIDVFSATSLTKQDVDSVLDASEAASDFGLSGPLLFGDNRIYHVFNQEFRASTRTGALRWMVGASYLVATTRVATRLRPASGPVINAGRLNERARELAIYADLGFEVSNKWTLDAGARLFSTRISNERQEQVGAAALRSTRNAVSPSFAISFKPSQGRYYYVRFASAFRPAGLDLFAPAQASRFKSDELTTIEVGGRWHDRDQRFSAQAVLYGSQWLDIQSDYLLPNGLVATRNSGSGTIYGIEGSAQLRLGRGWTLSGGGALQKARLESIASGLALPEDRQLPVVPDYQANLEVLKSFLLGAWEANVAVHAALVGPTRLSLDPGLDRKIGSHGSVDLSSSLKRGAWSFGLSVTNLFDSSADSFAFGNPFSIRQTDQHVPLRPRGIVLRAAWALP